MKHLALKFRLLQDRVFPTPSISFERIINKKWFFTLGIPSEISVFFREKKYYLGGGGYLSSLQNRISLSDKHYWKIGYSASLKLTLGYQIYKKMWIQFEIGNGFEDIKIFSKDMSSQEKLNRDYSFFLSFALSYLE